MIRMAALVLAFWLPGCGQDYNSNSGDAQKIQHESDDTITGSSTTVAALKVLRKLCFSCHTSWSAYKTDQDWIEQGYVELGNAKGSTLVQMLINDGGNMPQGGSALSDSDYNAILDWINGMVAQ